MISLLKMVGGPWEVARGYLLEDLEHIELAINQRWAETFGDSNQLDLAGDAITGILPVEHGGTGNDTFTDTRIPFYNATLEKFVDDADLTFDTDTLIATKVRTPIVIGGTGTTSTLTLKTTTGVGASGADIIFQVGNNGATEAARILNNGNFGIGFNNPSEKLNVKGVTRVWPASDGDVFYFTDAAISRSLEFQTLNSAGGAGWYINANTTVPIDFGTSDTFRMRIDGDGEVGIGTDNPTRKLHVSGSGENVAAAVFNTANSSGNNARLEVWAAGASGGDPVVHFGIGSSTEWSAGIDNSDSDKFKFAVGGSSANPFSGTMIMTLVSATTRVGIGEASPGATLDVRAKTSSGDNIASFRNDANNVMAWITYDGSRNGIFHLQDSAQNARVSLYTDPSTDSFWNPGGDANFGFNTSTPATLLSVGGGTNGQQLGIHYLTELTTIAAAATTDTTIQMPAGAIILAVSVRVTVAIPTATTFTVGDSGNASRFSTAAVSTAANSTNAGTAAGAYYNASALSVRITPDASPAANTGRVRVTIFYFLSTPPTS